MKENKKKSPIKKPNVKENGKSFQIDAQSKSPNKRLKSYEKSKNVNANQIDVIIEKKYWSFSLDFIFRREKYTLKNLKSNFLVSKIKKLIAKKLSIDLNLLHFFYLEKELIDDSQKIYDLIKDNKIKYLEIKKESPINGNVISLNTNVNLIYKVKCKNIENTVDFIEKIENFFTDKCLEKHFLCEPIGDNAYEVGFACEDLCYQFKRYMMIIKKMDDKYKKSSYEFIQPERDKVLMPKFNESGSGSSNYKEESIFINQGPYVTYEELQRQNEKEEKKKWINKGGFVFKNNNK